MKKVLAFLLVLAMLTTLTACGKSGNESDVSEDVSIGETESSAGTDTPKVTKKGGAEKENTDSSDAGNASGGKVTKKGGATATAKKGSGKGTTTTTQKSGVKVKAPFRQKSSGTVRVLCIGNRYATDAITNLYPLAASEGVSMVLGIASAATGALKIHLDAMTENGIYGRTGGLGDGYYQKFSPANPQGLITRDKTLKQILQEESWDYVVLVEAQDGSSDSGKVLTTVSTMAGKVKSLCKNSNVQILFQENFGKDNFETAKIRGAATELVSYSEVHSLPVASAFLEAQEIGYTVANGSKGLTAADGYANGRGKVLINTVWFETLTGKGVGKKFYYDTDLVGAATKAVKGIGLSVSAPSGGGSSAAASAGVIKKTVTQGFESFALGESPICSGEVTGVTNKRAHSGTKSLEVIGRDFSQMSRPRFLLPIDSNYAEVELGKGYTVSFWVYADYAGCPGVEKAGSPCLNNYVSIITNNADLLSTDINDKSVHDIQGTEQIHYPIETDKWVQVTYDIPAVTATNLARQGVYFLEFGITYGRNGYRINLFIDDITVTPK